MTTGSSVDATSTSGAQRGMTLIRGEFPIGTQVAIVVGFGLVCRIAQYLANTSLWHDEAYIALNILHRSFGGLFGPLEWHEASPPLFTVAVKALVGVAGHSEYAFRLVALLAGLAGLIVFARLARDIFASQYQWLWAVLMMAASAKLIAQANEVKHFTLDTLAAVMLLRWAIRCWYEPRPAADLIAWGIIGAVSIWFSYASAFVLAGTSIVLMYRAMTAWRSAGRAAYVAANLIAMLSALTILGPVRAQMSGPMIEFWRQSYGNAASAWVILYWFGRSMLGLFDYFWQPMGALLLVLAMIGAAAMWHDERRPILMMMTAPIAATLAASFAHLWPFGGNQHMVFAAPAVFIVVAEGIERVRQRLIGRSAWMAAVFIAITLIPGIAPAAYHIVYPRQRHEVRAVLDFVRRHRQPGDRFLIQCPPEVEFYTGHELLALPPAGPSSRLWVLTTASGRHGLDAASIRAFAPDRPYLTGDQQFGAAAYLFGPAQPADSRTAP